MGKKGHSLLFLWNFLKNPLRNASIISSSVTSSKAMISRIDFSKVDTILELGPGNGPITRQILKVCKVNTKIILVELEKSYLEILQDQFGDKVIIENSCASQIETILKKHGIQKVDLIISGLPFLPKKTRNKMYSAIEKQTNMGAIFRFFTYMPPIMKQIYKALPIREKSFTWKNIPPFWVYGLN